MRSRPKSDSLFFLLRNIIRGNILHNWPGAFQVMRLLTVHKMKAGLLNHDHPWITGKLAGSDEFIWPQNIVFSTQLAGNPPADDRVTDSDHEIVIKVGRFLSAMVAKSIIIPEIPHGPKRRMPHAINYLHGSVHFNGVTLLFNNFSEAKDYVSDSTFRDELIRMIRIERREVTFVFRERNYDPVEFAYFSCFVMSHLPWFANVNGAQRRVMWGNASPYPALNIINGSWLGPVEALRHGNCETLARPAIAASAYFQGSYGTEARDYHFIERMHAYLINNWVRKRGFNAGLYFVKRKKIEPIRFKQYLAAGNDAEPINEPIPSPLKQLPKKRYLLRQLVSWKF